MGRQARGWHRDASSLCRAGEAASDAPYTPAQAWRAVLDVFDLTAGQR